MNRFVSIGLGSAAVVVVLLGGVMVFGTSGVGGPGASPTPSPTPTPTRIPDSGQLDAGTYLMTDGASTIRITIPLGWDAAANGTDIRKNRDQPGEVAFGLYLPDVNVWPDACATDSIPPRTGPTTDDLVAALRAQQNSDVSEPAEITVGGTPGVRLDIAVPDGLDIAGCSPDALRIWSDATGNGNFFAFGGPGTIPISILETPSGRLVYSWIAEPGASAADVAELQAIVDSIQVEPAP